CSAFLSIAYIYDLFNVNSCRTSVFTCWPTILSLFIPFGPFTKQPWFFITNTILQLFIPIALLRSKYAPGIHANVLRFFTIIIFIISFVLGIFSEISKPLVARMELVGETWVWVAHLTINIVILVVLYAFTFWYVNRRASQYWDKKKIQESETELERRKRRVGKPDSVPLIVESPVNPANVPVRNVDLYSTEPVRAPLKNERDLVVNVGKNRQPKHNSIQTSTPSENKSSTVASSSIEAEYGKRYSSWTGSVAGSGYQSVASTESSGYDTFGSYAAAQKSKQKESLYSSYDSSQKSQGSGIASPPQTEIYVTNEDEEDTFPLTLDPEQFRKKKDVYRGDTARTFDPIKEQRLSAQKYHEEFYDKQPVPNLLSAWNYQQQQQQRGGYFRNENGSSGYRNFASDGESVVGSSMVGNSSDYTVSDVNYMQKY
ncbi:hypothetical protein HK098_006835, partial [Nowakowskiella sp. JEL0407]